MQQPLISAGFSMGQCKNRMGDIFQERGIVWGVTALLEGSKKQPDITPADRLPWQAHVALL
jgi:hypothetical protein